MSDYFTQRVQCDTSLQRNGRASIFRALCEGKRVLHIGCADYPVFDPANNLHLFLQQHCEIHGVDWELDAIRPHCIYPVYKEIPKDQSWDLVIVPEVLEHVTNAGDFLKELDEIDTKHYVITVPDAYSCASHFRDKGEYFEEVVHPDHKCWYSPYTLQKAIQSSTGWTIDKLALINHISVMAMCTK